MISINSYLTCSDLPKPTQVWTILQIDQRMAGNSNEIGIRFSECPEKLLILGAVDAQRVSSLYGPNSQPWVGQKLKVYCLVTASPDMASEAIGVCGPNQSPLECACVPSPLSAGPNQHGVPTT